MNGILTFGDVFRHKEKEYVYLASTADVVYAARILNTDEGRQILGLMEKLSANRSRITNPLFCFVVLDTEDFKDRLAHFAKTGKDELGISIEKIGKLNATDLAKIKEEIKKDNTIMPTLLKELVADITL